MLYLGRVLYRFDYSVWKTSDLEGLSLDHRTQCRRIEELEALLEAAHEDIANMLKASSTNNQVELGNLLKVAKTDFQLIMAHQSLLASFDDLDPAFRPFMEFVKPYTMTSVERLYDLYKSVEYICKAKIPGDMLECGVWRGGSMMLVAKTLVAVGDTSRTLYLFDTYEGHPKPDVEEDVDLWGNRAVDDWVKHRKTDESSDWAYVSIDEVRANMESTGYPMDKVVLVKGMVESTATTPTSPHFSMVRLDTDWYASAKISLETFWPRLSRGGVLIVDDYGHYRGQRKAVDEYFAKIPVKLNRVDYSCRSIVKT